jgi:voltage-gated potassium channel
MNAQKEIKLTLVLVLVIVVVGVLSFMHLEEWNIVDALYYVTSVLTTVGSGDIVPITVGGRIISIIYMWLGVAIVVSSIGYVGTSLIKKHIIKGDIN